jgi:hypothetical protein
MQQLAKPRWSDQDRPVIRQLLLRVISVQIVGLLAVGAVVMFTQDRPVKPATSVAGAASTVR